jgi:hypothetical protein
MVPSPELADVICQHAHRLDQQDTPIRNEHRKVLTALACCRTAALGGHIETCDCCGHRRIAYNSCRNRHCPKCQGSACAKWMADRAEELLPVEYFHVVFTLPDAFNPLALGYPRVVYDVLFSAAAQTLLEVAANPKNLGAKVGFMSILHTWGQNLQLHPHVHCVIPGGGLSSDGSRWIACRPGFFLPVRILSRVFRGKFIDLLRHARHAGKLVGLDDDAFERLLDRSVRDDWVVYAKPPFGGPEQVLKYLSRYTHRIAISNRRIVSMDDQTVTFVWKDYAHHHRQRTMTLDGAEFLRRFLMHVVPRGFVRIRHFGLLANRARSAMIARCRELIAVASHATIETNGGDSPLAPSDELPRCPACHRGKMIAGPNLAPHKLATIAATMRLDTS